jgi:PiT family inorganic phosphate transporter
MDPALILVIVIIATALIFDFLNGFHDAANAIATVVVSRTLTPGQAILLAGAANFIGYFGFGLAVAKTIGKGVVHLDQVTLPLILASLIGAIIWNIMTWWWGLPTSSSHALIGGLVGAGIASAGMKAVVIGGVLKIAAFIIIAPLLGMIGSGIFTVIIIWAFRKIKPRSANTVFRYLQLLSATWYAVGHGTNDAQKTMGIIAMTLVAGGIAKDFHLAPWIIISCYSAISLGTMFGGWRIVRTMGTRITKVRAMEGFCAESAAALVLMGTAHFGVPVSTTHVISGAIMGVGAVEHAARVRWVTARKIIWAWILTMPITAAFAALAYLAISVFA